ncbi:MAG: type II toxin-antitoxin system VapC family toxin [Acidobacteria bacterium]|nr:type II toxin-antitoxin system VapC family toxin [Acidobacteriota bacterium]
MIILDTNVLSEVMRPFPTEEVLRWLATQPASRLFTTTITQAEILYGLELLPRGKRRAAFESAVEAMFEEDFADRILPFDSDAARVFPQIAASRRALGRPITQWDAQIAAIARSRGAVLATRNTGDFEHCGITVLNPWGAP